MAISISPSGGDESGGVSASVAEAVRVIRESGLPTETNAMFTNIEGEWDEVMAVVKRAVMTVAETSPRVGLVLKADLRAGHDTGQLTAQGRAGRAATGRRRRCGVTPSTSTPARATRSTTSPVSAPTSCGRTTTGCCTSSSRTPPRGWRSSRPAPAPTTTCSPRWPTCFRPTTAGGTGTARAGHGRSHVMPALVPPYATVPVVGGRLMLGTWQSICLVDLNVDNPDREVRLSFLGG